MAYLYFFHLKEGFETTLEMTQDRANPLAAQQQPLTNPATNIGISQDSGANIRELSQVALNSPLEDSVFKARTSGDPGIAFGLKSERNMNTISPRIDNEDSFLGMIKFCKDTVDSSGKNAWQNPKFSRDCGICMTDTTLLIDDKARRTYNSSNGTGVLVYHEDKLLASNTQLHNNFRYPRAIPSLRAADCTGTSLTDDEKVPVLAINSNMYADMFSRNECKHTAAFNTLTRSCGQCQSDRISERGTWSYIKQPPAGNLRQLSIRLYGSGNATIRVNNQIITGGSGIVLSNEPTIRSFGDPNNPPYIKEGDPLSITVTGGNDKYLQGIIHSIVPNGSEHLSDLYNTLSNDTITGIQPKPHPTEKRLFRGKEYITMIPGLNRDSMILQGILPYTYIDGSNYADKSKNQIAYYDCKAGPYKTDGTIIETSSHCPPVRPPGGYSDSCIRSILTSAGCTSAGDWYQRVILPVHIASSNLSYIRNWLSTAVANAESDPYIFMGCYGANRSNVCDTYIGTNAVPSRDCLQLLYDNTITRRNLISTSNSVTPYSAAGENFLNYRALNGNTDRYCRPEGALNPSSGNATLSNIALGYRRSDSLPMLTGIAAVNDYLSYTYSRAVNNQLDIHVPDSNGGRKTSWENCFGTIIRPKEVIPVNNISDTVNCQQVMGKKNVYLLENSSITISHTPEYMDHYENTGQANTYWIWGDQVYSNNTFTFYFNYCNGNGAFTGTLLGNIRNSGTLRINNNIITPTSSGVFTNTPVQIIVGNNTIVVNSTGSIASAGFWLLLKDSSGRVLMKTNETWRCE
jgi:hypothetical protein